MADNDDPTTGPAEPAPPPVPADSTVEQTVVTERVAEPGPVAPAAPRFTERVWNFRAMVAVALAALLLGGGIGAAISAVSHDDGSDRRPGFVRFEDGPGGPGGPFMAPGPGGLDRQQRQQLRKDFNEFRQRMKQRLKDEENAPTPTAPPTPGPSSNG